MGKRTCLGVGPDFNSVTIKLVGHEVTTPFLFVSKFFSFSVYGMEI